MVSKMGRAVNMLERGGIMLDCVKSGGLMSRLLLESCGFEPKSSSSDLK